MKSRKVLSIVGLIFFSVALVAKSVPLTNSGIATPPVYVPDTSHQYESLPDDVLTWKNLMLATNAAADQSQVHFTFNFTNVSSNNVVILDVRPSCGCTTAELPSLPWTIPPGTNGRIPVTVNIADKTGTLSKSIDVTTDKGFKNLFMQIVIAPPPPLTMSAADRARGVAMAKIDRQAVFKNDCATCHVAHGEGKYGKVLFDADCAICHEAENRATMVPDLHNLKVPTNPDFWKTWISHGKAGSFMPAFSTADGGPLNDMQIASLVGYLNAVNPSKVPSPQ
jgi:cytochrome c553